jgi:hypothetical protein
VKLKCQLLSLLRIHHSDCQYCAREAYGMEMRKRLEDLNWGMRPNVSNFGDRAEGIELKVFDSQPAEVITLPVSLKVQHGKRSA